ncbi:hypothetical protein GCM10007242_40100 [Pigmentiphaga litoralis]|nr:hypothetical protein GCM10007242_40100 [Pigmentiphaga litoralis]
MDLLQLLLERRNRRRIQETEGHAAFLAVDGMVDAVCLVQPLEISLARCVAPRQAAMHQPVVRQEIQQAIGRHAGAYPFQRVMAGRPERDQHDRHAREHDGVQVVLFEPARARRVMRRMPAPSPAVHDVLVRDDGEKLHPDYGRDKNEAVDQYVHQVTLR